MADITREVLLKILLDASQTVAGLRNLANESANATAAQKEAAQAGRQETQGNERRRRSLQDLAAGLFVVRSAYAAVTGALRQLQATGQQAFNFLIRGNEELQKSAVGTAAAIASSNNVLDENGREIENTAEAIQRLVPALEAARVRVAELAAEIPGITENDIRPIFENLAGSVGELGLEIEELPRLAASTAAAFQVLNVPLFQTRQEIQSLIRGEVNRNTEIANRLGLQREDLLQAKERGELGEFLAEQFEAAAEGASLLSDLTENATSNLQTFIERVGRRLGEPLLQPVQQLFASVVEFLNENEDRIVEFFEPLIGGAVAAGRQAIVFGQQFLDATRPAREAIGELFQSLAEFGQAIASTGLLEFFQDLFQVLQQQVAVALQRAAQFFTVLIDVGRQFLPILETQIDLVEKLVDAITLGELSLQRLNREIRELSNANDELSEGVSKLNDGISLTEQEFNRLEDAILRAAGPRAQEIIERFRQRNQELLAVEEQRTEQLESRRVLQQETEEEERLQFQRSQNRFNIEADLRKDAAQDLEQESELIQQVVDAEQSRLNVLQAQQALENQRSGQRLSVLESEEARLQEQARLLEERGASEAARRRNARQLESVQRQIADEQIATAQRQQALQEQQNIAKSAEIESQRTLNQLKIDQAEIENEINRIQLDRQSAEIQDEINRADEENLTPAEVSALEDRLRGVNAAIARSLDAAGQFEGRRQAINQSAANQQAALGFTNQAAREAFLDEIGQLLVQRGDRDAERIAGSRRLDPLERSQRLRELASEQTGITLEAPQVMVQTPQGAVPQIEIQPTGTSQPSQSANRNTELLEAILAKIPSDLDVGVSVGQAVSTGVVSQPPVAEGGLDFVGGGNVAATGG